MNNFNNGNNNSYYNGNNYNDGFNGNYGTPMTQSTSVGYARYIAKTYLWMFFGLAITFGLSMYMTLNSYSVIDFIDSHFELYMGACLISILMVFAIGFLVYKLPPLVAKIIFIVYAADMGVLLTPTLLVYSLSSVISVFAATSVIYLALAIVGLTTKKDISKWGSMLTFTLLGIILYSAISYFFIHSSLNNIIIGAVFIAIFMGFTIFDNYRIKKQYNAFQGNPQLLEKTSILSALSLYLDYINIFIRLLSIFGKKR